MKIVPKYSVIVTFVPHAVILDSSFSFLQTNFHHYTLINASRLVFVDEVNSIITSTFYPELEL